MIFSIDLFQNGNSFLINFSHFGMFQVLMMDSCQIDYIDQEIWVGLAKGYEHKEDTFVKIIWCFAFLPFDAIVES